MINAVTALSTPPLIATTTVLPTPSRGPIFTSLNSSSVSVVPGIVGFISHTLSAYEEKVSSLKLAACSSERKTTDAAPASEAAGRLHRARELYQPHSCTPDSLPRSILSPSDKRTRDYPGKHNKVGTLFALEQIGRRDQELAGISIVAASGGKVRRPSNRPA